MPGALCAVADCKSTFKTAKESGLNIRFFRFPKDSETQKEWIARCHRQEQFHPEHKRICSKHFTEEDFEDVIHARITGTLPRKLKPTAIPSVSLQSSESDRENNSNKTNRAKRNRNKTSAVRILKEKEPSCSYELSPDASDVEEILVIDTEIPLNDLQQKYDKLLKENATLRQKNTKITKDLKTLQKNWKKRNVKLSDHQIKKILSEFLTDNQIDVVLKKKKKPYWNAIDISRALTLRYLSQRAYIYIRQTLKYPLPGVITLQRWASNMNLSGILCDVLKIMETYGKSKTAIQKVTVLSFGEINICEKYEYDQTIDEIVGPHKYLQIVMARGLFDEWKQPVYIRFDQKITKDILNELITELHNINYTIVACTSDCNSENMVLWKELSINVNSTFFLNPVTGEKIHFFADVPHLLKSVRNWFIDVGFVLEDGTIITATPLENLLGKTQTKTSPRIKLTGSHLKCEKLERQDIILASQLLSHSTATALEYYFSADEHSCDVSEFLHLVSSWFDVLNSCTSEPSVISQLPYGKNLEIQNYILDEAILTFSSMRCISKANLQLFQRGIVISSKSLRNLYDDMKHNYGISYILTRRLNQDCLEELFAQIRTDNGSEGHPSPVNALYHVRMALVGKHPNIVHKHSDFEMEENWGNEEYISVSVLKRAKINFIEENPPEEDSFPESSTTIIPILEKDGLVYIAGLIANKFKDQYDELEQYTLKLDKMENDHTYYFARSSSDLAESTDAWAAGVTRMETYFNKYHGTHFKSTKAVIASTTNYVYQHCSKIDKPLVAEFARQRIFFRIKYVNSQLKIKMKFGKRAAETDENRKHLNKLLKPI